MDHLIEQVDRQSIPLHRQSGPTLGRSNLRIKMGIHSTLDIHRTGGESMNLPTQWSTSTGRVLTG